MQTLFQPENALNESLNRLMRHWANCRSTIAVLVGIIQGNLVTMLPRVLRQSPPDKPASRSNTPDKIPLVKTPLGQPLRLKIPWDKTPSVKIPERMKGLVGLRKCEWITYSIFKEITHRNSGAAGIWYCVLQTEMGTRPSRDISKVLSRCSAMQMSRPRLARPFRFRAQDQFSSAATRS